MCQLVEPVARHHGDCHHVFRGTNVGLPVVVVFLDAIHSVVVGPDIVWNSTAIVIVALQAVVAISSVAATLFFQNRKRDFI